MQDKDYLLRSLQLAKKGGKSVRPNPQVGAVIVHDGRIIGEGYHKKYGEAHAEVNAINDVAPKNRKLLSESTIYVSLEPCCHFGNTPPCTDLIIRHHIPRVCISEIDPTQKVNNKGIRQLQENGISVEIIPLSENHTLAEFRVNELQSRPYVQLKLAKSKDNYIGKADQQIWLTNPITNSYTHKLRAYTDAILVGTNTALVDNPTLNVRNYIGASPLRVVLDRSGKIPKTHALLSDNLPTLIITEVERPDLKSNKTQLLMNFTSKSFIEYLLSQLYQSGIHHLLVEGGAQLHKSFLKTNTWDEAVIIETPHVLQDGIKAPNIHGKLLSTLQLGDDKVLTVKNNILTQ